MARQATAIWGGKGETRKAGTNTPLATFETLCLAPINQDLNSSANHLLSTYNIGLRAFIYSTAVNAHRIFKGSSRVPSVLSSVSFVLCDDLHLTESLGPHTRHHQSPTG